MFVTDHSSENRSDVSAFARVVAPDEAEPMVPPFGVTVPVGAVVFADNTHSPVSHVFMPKVARAAAASVSSSSVRMNADTADAFNLAAIASRF